MSLSLSGAHLLFKLRNVVSVAENHCRCFVTPESRDLIRLSLCFKIKSFEISGYKCCRESIRCRDGSCFCHVLGAKSSTPHTSLTAACASSSHGATEDADSDADSDSDREPGPDPKSDPPPLLSEIIDQHADALKEAASPLLPVPADSLEPESWMLTDGEDVPTLVSNLPLREKYAPRRLLEFIAKKVDSKMFSPAELKSALMFWQKKKLEENTSFASSAFGEKGVSQIYQWTATELTLQHARLSRIARDILYLVLACSLLGFVRVLEALFATFSSSPPHYSKLLDAANSLDFFTMAFLAYSVRKPVIGILRVDPTNLDEVVHLKAKIWDEMHKFYERQWKVVATLAVGRLLALITQKLPSTNAMTRNMKMCWDFLLALPIF